MSRCLWCAKTGPLVVLKETGLCRVCGPTISHELSRRLPVLQDAVLESHYAPTRAERLARWDQAYAQAKVLLPYEEKGLHFAEPRPSQVVTDYATRRSALLTEALYEDVDPIVGRALRAPAARVKAAKAEDAVRAIHERRYTFHEPGLVTGFDDELVRYGHLARVVESLDTALRAETRGDTPTAVDAYRDALHLLKRQENGDARAGERIANIEGKLAQLEAKGAAAVPALAGDTPW